GDASAFPGMPADYAKYFGPGTGGMITRNDVPASPDCVAKARANPSIYAASASNAPARGCIAAKGGVAARRLGPVALGDSERQVRQALGDPLRLKRGFLRWCLINGGSIRVGEPGDRSGELGPASNERAVVVLSTSRFYSLRGLRPGGPARRLGRAFRRRVQAARIGRTRIYATRRGGGVLVAW